jgi:branched-chain amino acid transport system substrate-binding protein
MNTKTLNRAGGFRKCTTAVVTLTGIALIVSGCSVRGGGSDASSTAAATGSVTADCDSYDPTAGVTADSIKIGTTLPVTGPLAGAGTIRYGMQAYLDFVNDQGGIDGRKIELVVRDDGYDPAKAAANVNELVNNEKVFALFGQLGTANILAVQPDLEANCVPNLLVQSGSPAVEGSYWTISQFPSYALDGEVLAKAAIAQGAKKVSIIAQNDDFGEAYTGSLIKTLDDAGVDVSKQTTYEVGAPSIDSQVTQLAADGADAVLVAGNGTACPQILNGINASGWKPQILTTSFCASKSLLSLLDAGAGDGSISTAFYKSPGDAQWAGDEALDTYRAALAKYEPSADPDEDYVLDGWLEGQLLVDILKSAATIDRAGAMESAWNANIAADTLLPGITFQTGPDKHDPLTSVQLRRYNAGTDSFVFVDPETGDALPAGQVKLATGGPSDS